MASFGGVTSRARPSRTTNCPTHSAWFRLGRARVLISLRRNVPRPASVCHWGLGRLADVPVPSMSYPFPQDYQPRQYTNFARLRSPSSGKAGAASAGAATKAKRIMPARVFIFVCFQPLPIARRVGRRCMGLVLPFLSPVVQPPVPVSRTAMRVGNCHNADVFFSELVDHAIRKARRQATTRPV